MKQKQERKKKFTKGTGSGGGVGAVGSSHWLHSEVLEPTQPEVLEAHVYKSSSSEYMDFTSKLVSPRNQVTLHSRMSAIKSTPETPPDKIIKKIHSNTGARSKMIRDLNHQIINQNNVIAKL